MKKVLSIIFTVIFGLYLIAAPAWLGYLIKQIPCSGIMVDLKDLYGGSLITESEIHDIVRNTAPYLKGVRTGDIRTSDIEEKVRQLREVKNAEAYFTIEGTLCIMVIQRNPILRVFAGGGDFFLDEDGVLIRKRKLHAPRLHIAGGNISISRAMLDGVSVLDTSIRISVLKDIYKLVNYIRTDQFWSAQVDQIWVDGNNEINLIPRTGNHIVHLGTIENLEEKFDNLGKFYEEILPLAGWDAYNKINIEYKGQIVCTRNR